ncbi:probable methyltransferase-like protein 25 [Argopecten irradians]|uniref:probable methyltransferase-like protein 25 n=1 Tax=Argopecten irradians TaxID=31199 RepID=UPI00371D5D77
MAARSTLDRITTLTTIHTSSLSASDEWPDSLKDFIKMALTLSLPRSPSKRTTTLSIDPEMRRGMTPKKQHEVALMSSVVHDVAQRSGCDVILDIGSGLGNLNLMGLPWSTTTETLRLSHYWGVECKQCHTSGAERRVHSTDHHNGIQNVTFELEKGQENMDKFSELVSNTCQQCNQGNAIDNKMKEMHLKQQRESSQTCSSSPVEGQGSYYENLVLRQPPTQAFSDQDNVEECMNGVSSEKLKTRQECELLNQEERNVTMTMSTQCDRCDSCDNELDSLTLKQHEQVQDAGESCQKSRDVAKTDLLKHSSDFSDNFRSPCSNDMVLDSQLTLTKPEKPMTLTLPWALMIGLHCCGDLTPTMMEYFRRLDFIRGLCCVSCCYHRMKVKAGAETLDNFPISATANKIYNTLRGDHPKWNLGTFALRLAAQETRGRWGQQTAEDHDYHTRNVGYRGILELYKHKNSTHCEKVFRKIARKSDFTSFTAYVDAAIGRLQAGEETGIDRTELCRLYEENKDKMKYIEPITALQYLLQPVLEVFITTDRAQHLKENGLTPEIVPIFNEVISPRNLALISVK